MTSILLAALISLSCLPSRANAEQDLLGSGSWDGRGTSIAQSSEATALPPPVPRTEEEQTIAQTSAFEAVRAVLRDENIPPLDAESAAELRSYANGGLPHYTVTVQSFFKGSVNLLERDAKRTIAEQADFYDRIAKLLHPNGICFAGTWDITEESPYTGYFAKGAKARLIARASAALSETERGDARGFGFAGKLFPAEETGGPVKTANFFLVDQLTGTKADHYLDVAMTNEPDLGFTWSLRLLKTISDALKKADVSPMFRPLYPLAEYGLKPGETPRTPKWMMIKPAREMGRSAERDFRRELDVKNYPQGLIFNISVSDSTRDRKSDTGWREVGRIVLKESFVSYGCDRRVHFPHPKLK